MSSRGSRTCTRWSARSVRPRRSDLDPERLVACSRGRGDVELTLGSAIPIESDRRVAVRGPATRSRMRASSTQWSRVAFVRAIVGGSASATRASSVPNACSLAGATPIRAFSTMNASPISMAPSTRAATSVALSSGALHPASPSARRAHATTRGALVRPRRCPSVGVVRAAVRVRARGRADPHELFAVRVEVRGVGDDLAALRVAQADVVGSSVTVRSR